MANRLDVTARKIRNGKRKQAEKILEEKMKVWERLKKVPKPGMTIEKVYITAPTRKLRAKWTVDPAQEQETIDAWIAAQTKKTKK